MAMSVSVLAGGGNAGEPVEVVNDLVHRRQAAVLLRVVVHVHDVVEDEDPIFHAGLSLE